MIARTWRGTTIGTDAERYAAYLHETGVAECRALPGNLGVLVLRRSAGERAEFEFVSFWEDEAAVRRFAGPDPERAVFYPADDAFLVERETRVTHWEVVETAAVPGGQDMPGVTEHDHRRDDREADDHRPVGDLVEGRRARGATRTTLA